MTAETTRLRGDQLTRRTAKTIAESLNVTIPDGHFTAIITLTARKSTSL